MAANTGGDKYIGKLKLDLSEIQKQIKEVNDWLGKIGANINLEDQLSKKVSAALQKLVDEAKKAGEEAQKAVTDITKGDNLHGLESNMAKVASVVSTTVRTTEDGIGKVVSSVTSGFDAAGNKIREFANAEGEITRRTTEVTNAVQQAVAVYQKLFEAGTKINDMEAKGDTKSTAYLKASQDVARLYQELSKIDETTRKAAQATEEYARAEELFNAAAEMAEQRSNEAAQAEESNIDRLVAKATQADEKKAAAAERAAEREAQAAAKAAQKEIEERQKLTVMYRQMFDEIERRNNAEMDAKNAEAAKQEQAAVEHLIALYQMYFEYKTKAVNAGASGNTASEEMYTGFAHSILEQIQALNELNPLLVQTAENSDRVATAQMAWQNAITSSAVKDAASAEKERIQYINEYKLAILDLIKAQTDFNNQVASGKLSEGTDKYKEAEENLERLQTAAVQAGQKIDESGRQMAESTREVSNAFAQLRSSEAGLRDAGTPDYLRQVTDAYNTLKEAINNYNIAKKAENEQGMALWQDEINKQMQIVSSIEQIVGSLNIESGVRDQIISKIEQAKTLQDGFTKGVVGGTSAASDLESQMSGLLTRMFSIMAVIRTISNLISNTVEYVSEYSDKMNEIQMITLKTDEEVAQLADTYRELASMMNVSSLDMADAAIYFTRQGLGAAEIEKRLKNVTMYAKAANVEFTEASEIITAVVNSMGLANQEMEDGRNAAQRVADVFLKVGDNAATSGQEIGSAMQKAAASAGAFGVSFEWLASAIATVSETTRQEARTIGTAFNTIIARLHQIRTTGYNSEDETTINDVAKALSRIDVALMDQYGNWRNMEDVWNDVASKWGELDGKTKSYIATTMAGVKQQNVFLADMNDMSKTIEEGGRFWELYGIAMDSAGTAAEKYNVYLDSVTASQERLTIAQEKFYSLLDANVIKGWNDALAGFVDMIATGAEKAGTWTVVLPVVIGLVTTLAIAIKSAGTASLFFANIWEKHPVLVAIAAGIAVIATLVTVINAATSAIETQEERLAKANQTIEESNQKLQEYTSLQSKAKAMFSELGDEGTNKTLEDYNSLLSELGGLSTTARQAVDDLKDGLISQKEAAEQINGELDKYIEKQREINVLGMLSKLSNTEKDSKAELAQRLMQYGVSNDAEFGSFLYKVGTGTAGDWLDQLDLYNTMDMEFLNMIEEYKKTFSYIEDDTERWYQIGRAAWLRYFDGAESVTNYATDKVNNLINETISTISVGLDNGTKGMLKDKLSNMIFGPDGMLDATEAKNYSGVIHDFLSEWFVDGFKFSDEEITAYIDKLFVDIARKSGEHLNDNGDMMLWEDLDLETVQLVSDLIDAGTELSHIKDLMRESETVDEFKEKLANIGKDVQEGVEEGAEETETFVEKMKTLTSEIDKLNKIIDTLRKGETVDFEDLLNLADAHPEIMGAINDAQALLAVIQELKEADMGKVIDTLRNDLYNSVEFANETGFETNGGTLADFMKRGKTESADVEKYVDRVIASFLGATDKLGSVSKEIIGQWMNSLFDEANMDLLDRKILDFGDHIETTISEIYTASADGSEGLKWNQNIVMSFTPITPDGRKLDEDEMNRYVEELLSKSTNAEDLKTYDKTENGGLGLLISADVDFTSFEDAIANAESLMDLLHLLQEAYYGVTDANKTWLDLQIEQMEKQEELDWAKSNGYLEQINELNEAMSAGGTDGIQAAYDIWSQYNDEMKKAISDTYPNIAKAMYDIEKALKDETKSAEKSEAATKRMNEALKNSKKIATAEHFKDTYAAIQKLEKGTISAAEAYEVFNKEVNKVTKAQEDINDVTTKLADDTEITASDVSNLATVLGMSADEIIADFPGAVDMFNELISATGELQSALDLLNAAAFIKITGVSEADFSNIENGMLAVQDMAKETIDLLVATGQWELDTIPINGMMSVWENGKIVKKELSGYQQVLKATGNNPYKGSQKKTTADTKTKKKGGGGGGGSKKDSDSDTSKSSSSNDMTEVERMLDIMSQVASLQKTQQSFYQAQNNYYSKTGQLQGVIGYSKLEAEVLGKQNESLQSNLQTIEQYMAAKKEELSMLSNTDEKYEEVADDLDKLQKAHQEYTQALVENKTKIYELNEAIKEQQKKIRDMEIDLRNTILQAIKDREQKKQDMLNAEIEMENKILDLITKRYEKERDQIIETTNLKIDALKEEKDLLDEQLRIRKQQADEEDKIQKLQELELKYQRISADPTRQKEALQIRKQINDLRDEMAWDTAEREVQAQQDSIDQQITSLEDYIQYVEDYYEDLFEHPQKLIDEMRDIMTKTQDEIIQWLKENDDEYLNSSENVRTSIEQGWNDTLDNMYGVIKTYWEEVESIIEQGDEYIIDFLKENSAKYQEAGKLQAEAYVDEWQDKLDALKKAHQEVATEIARQYDVINKAASSASEESSNSSSGSGGGSGGGGGGGDTTTKYGYRFTDNGQTVSSEKIYDSADAAVTAGEARKAAIVAGYRAALQYDKVANVGAVEKYARGGYVYSTGPAWLDGTKQNPEAVLNPYQTKLFESMVKAMEQINRISVPTMPSYGEQVTGGNNISVGDIIVNVENLDTEDDYEELADKVSEVLMERIGRTAVVGGLRITTY